MKKLIYVLISSLTTVTLCISLIVASTFALFTSKSDVNIAMSYGKVKIIATVENLEAVSAKWNAAGYYEYVKPSVPGRFAVGGTYEYDSPNLTLTNIVPGDGVDFVIKIKNESTVDIKYETVITVAGDDMDLFDALEIKVNDAGIDKMKSTAVSEWQQAESGAAISDIKVSIKLPIDDTNPIVDEAVADSVDTSDGTVKQCKLVIGVYAVQANGEDNKYSDVYFISNHSDLSNVLDEIGDGGLIALGDDFNFTSDEPLDIPAGKNVVMDTNGNKMVIQSSNTSHSGLTLGTGSSLTITGTKDDENKVELNSATNAKPAIDVKGSNAELTFDNVTIECKNDNSKASDSTIPKASIEATGGASVNFADSVINVTDDYDKNNDYKRTYGVHASGNRTHVELESTTVNVSGSAVALSSERNAELTIEGCEINVENGGGTCPAIMSGFGGDIISINTVVNITGDISGTHPYGSSLGTNYNNTAIAYGQNADGSNETGGDIYIYGGEINLTPTSGFAIGIATNYGTQGRMLVGGGLTINVKAGDGAKAAAFAAGQQAPMRVYNDTDINITPTSDGRNIKEWYDNGCFQKVNDGIIIVYEEEDMPYPSF